MDESRRQLFKTSTLSALGLMSGVAITGCATPISKGEGSKLDGPFADNSIIVGYSGSIWYIFKPDGPRTNYLVYSTPYGNVAPSRAYLDTQQFYDKAAADQRLTSVTLPFSLGGHQYTFSNNSAYLDTKSEDYLTQQTKNKASPGRWNEIGSA